MEGHLKLHHAVLIGSLYQTIFIELKELIEAFKNVTGLKNRIADLNQ